MGGNKDTRLNFTALLWKRKALEGIVPNMVAVLGFEEVSHAVKDGTSEEVLQQTYGSGQNP